MSAWRVIITDSESMTGVAPVCEDPGHIGNAVTAGLEPEEEDTRGTGPLVFDCCPHPHIETWGEATAEKLARDLTEADAEACS